MERFVGAIDQGTTGTRFMVFDEEGNVVEQAYEEHKQIYPKPGWVEHDAKEIMTRTRSVIERCQRSLDRKFRSWEIVAVGVTNQRETTVAWNRRTGEPLYNAIVWQDTRTKDICETLPGELIQKKTGLVVNTYFSATKMKWLLNNVIEDSRDVLFGTIDSWLIWNLTKEHVTDYTNASRTMLMDVRKLEWDDEILNIFGIDESMLPDIRSSSEVYGFFEIHGKEVPLCGALGDQQAALFGQACYEKGDAKNTFGTGNFLLMNTGREPAVSNSGLLTTVAYGVEGKKVNYALEGSIAVTGAAVQWLRDNLSIIRTADETEELGKSDNGGVYFVPAFSGLFAPYWDMSARGSLSGLTRFVRKEQIVRAVLESECYQSRDVMEAMEKDCGFSIGDIRVDGGATKNNLLMQLFADISGKRVVRPRVNETTALGAAYAAGLAQGYWKNTEELKKKWREDLTFEPSISTEERDALYHWWKKAVERSKGWLE
jgi:glycerol kinase